MKETAMVFFHISFVNTISPSHKYLQNLHSILYSTSFGNTYAFCFSTSISSFSSFNNTSLDTSLVACVSLNTADLNGCSPFRLP